MSSGFDLRAVSSYRITQESSFKTTNTDPNSCKDNAAIPLSGTNSTLPSDGMRRQQSPLRNFEHFHDDDDRRASQNDIDALASIYGSPPSEKSAPYSDIGFDLGFPYVHHQQVAQFSMTSRHVKNEIGVADAVNKEFSDSNDIEGTYSSDISASVYGLSSLAVLDTSSSRYPTHSHANSASDRLMIKSCKQSEADFISDDSKRLKSITANSSSLIPTSLLPESLLTDMHKFIYGNRPLKSSKDTVSAPSTNLSIAATGNTMPTRDLSGKETNHSRNPSRAESGVPGSVSLQLQTEHTEGVLKLLQSIKTLSKLHFSVIHHHSIMLKETLALYR